MKQYPQKMLTRFLIIGSGWRNGGGGGEGGGDSRQNFNLHAKENQIWSHLNMTVPWSSGENPFFSSKKTKNAATI